MNKVLQFSNVTITYSNGFCAVENISFALEKGQTLAIVGESGSGKTTIAKAILGILPKNAKVSGSIKVGETEIIGASEQTLRKVRGLLVGFVAQEPFSAFNPLAKVSDHLSEAWKIHQQNPNKTEIHQTLANFGIKDSEIACEKFPFQWSGGMLQRAVITASSAHKPQLIIADEPTSALDKIHSDLILESLQKTNPTLLLISHDLNLVAKYANQIAVCYQGKLIEIGETKSILEDPQHEFTLNLLADLTKEKSIKPKLKTEKVLEVKNLEKSYGKHQILKKISLTVESGEIVGISGNSGCGKSTLWRLLTTIETPSNGEVFFGNELAANGNSKKILSDKARKGFVMPIFQDPLSSLVMNWEAWKIITEPLLAKHYKQIFSKNERRKIAKDLLAEVGLGEIDLNTQPRNLSVGQCQRLAIARALAANPKLILADEPTSSLDVSIARKIMELFTEIAEKGTAIVIFSHQENLLKTYCHRVLKMDDGVLKNKNYEN